MEVHVKAAGNGGEAPTHVLQHSGICQRHGSIMSLPPSLLGPSITAAAAALQAQIMAGRSSCEDSSHDIDWLWQCASSLRTW